MQVNTRKSVTDYHNTINSLVEIAKEEFKELPDLLDNLNILRKHGREIASYASEYDFKDIQANGFWSVLNHGIRTITYGIDNFRKFDDRKKEKFRTFVQCQANGLKYAQIFREESLKRKGEIGTGMYQTIRAINVYYSTDLLDLHSFDSDNTARIFGDFIKSDQEIVAINSFLEIGDDFLVGLVVRWCVLGLSCSSFFEFFRCLWSQEFRDIRMREALTNIEMSSVKNFLSNSCENYGNLVLTPFLMNGFGPKVKRAIFVPRQKEFTLTIDPYQKTVGLERNDPNVQIKKPVRCRLLFEKTDPAENPGNSVVLHCHGGGFMSNSPDSHESYLRGWAQDTPGVPFISVEYSLAPGAQYPVATQEILDVYLWLISGSDDVRQMLGFTPEKIVLCGDSCGSLMIFALCVIIADIKKLFGTELKKPSALVSFYGSFHLSPYVTPALLLSPTHTMLIPHVLLACCQAYVPQAEENHNLDSNQEGERKESWIEIIKNTIATWFWWWPRERSIDPESRWFLGGYNALKKKIDDNFDVMSHPYLSPMFYPDFDCIKDTSMYLLALSSDPILDHTVDLAKKWKGFCKLDVIHNVTHAFLNFGFSCQKYRDAGFLCLQRLHEALGKDTSEGNDWTQGVDDNVGNNSRVAAGSA